MQYPFGCTRTRRRFALSGEGFSLESSEGIRGTRRGRRGGFAAETKGRTTCGFLPSWDSRFPCLLARRKSENGDRSEIGVRQSGYSSVSFSAFSQFTDSVLLHRSAICARLSQRKRGENQRGWKPWCPSLLCPRGVSAVPFASQAKTQIASWKVREITSRCCSRLSL